MLDANCHRIFVFVAFFLLVLQTLIEITQKMCPLVAVERASNCYQCQLEAGIVDAWLF